MPTASHRTKPLGLFQGRPAPRLCDHLFGVLRVRHYSRRTEEAYVRKARLTKRVTSHTFRHCFATHLLADGYDIRTVQELLGHKDVRTTMIYTHVLNRGGRAVRSPADALARRSEER